MRPISPTAVVLLGAHGRLGARLAEQISARGMPLLAVTRHRRDGRHRGADEVLDVDVTEAVHRAQAAADIARASADYPRVVVIDSVLDRASASAMRRSVHGSTELALDIAGRLRAQGVECHVAGASTTAVLAPFLLQTPYGLAKYRQLRAYAAAAVPLSAFLLPSLRPSPPADHPEERHGWTYVSSARAIVDTIDHGANLGTHQRNLFVPADLGRPIPRANASPAAGLVRTALRAHCEAFLVNRDCPHGHRAASHARLDLLPKVLRARVDHHLVPKGRLRRISRRINAHVRHLP